MAEVMAAHTVGFAHGGNGDMNIVVTFEATLVNGIGKTLDFAEMATLAIRAAFFNIAEIVTNALGSFAPVFLGPIAFIVAAGTAQLFYMGVSCAK